LRVNFYEGNTIYAAEIISSVSTYEGLNNIELNYLSFYNFYLIYLNSGFLTLEDKEQLYALAILCPGTNGACIYQARALYNAIYHVSLDPASCEEGEEDARKAYIQNKTKKSTESKWDVKFYPNPASDKLTIRCPAKEEILNIEIKDLSGRLVQKENLNVKDFFANLDLRLINGSYIINVVNSKHETVTKKLFIAK